MIKIGTQYLKLLILLILDLFYRIEKFFIFHWTRKHEVERICEASIDIYEKTMQFDQWLAKTKCEAIHNFLDNHFRNKTSKSLPHVTLDRILLSYSKSSNNNIPSKRNVKSPKCDKANYQTNLSDADLIFSSLLRELSEKLMSLILKVKGIKSMSSSKRDCMLNIIYRILSYKLTLFWAEKFAATPYDSDIDTHTDLLISFWNNLVRAEQQNRTLIHNYDSNIDANVFPPELSMEIKDKSAIVSNRWSHIGFQGEDPGTDFRGMGLLGLSQLEYLSTKPNRLARDLLGRSLNEEHSYPLAIVGINLTFNLLSLFRDGSMKHLYYDTGDIKFRAKDKNLKMVKIFNDLYVEMFLRFDCFWHESKPKTIFEFRELMEKFTSIVRMDLSNRNFSLKFIY